MTTEERVRRALIGINAKVTVDETTVYIYSGEHHTDLCIEIDSDLIEIGSGWFETPLLSDVLIGATVVRALVAEGFKI